MSKLKLNENSEGFERSEDFVLEVIDPDGKLVPATIQLKNWDIWEERGYKLPDNPIIATPSLKVE